MKTKNNPRTIFRVHRMPSARQLADAIMLNVDAMYEDSIPFDYFQKTQTRLWDQAQSLGLVTDVCELLLPKHLPVAQ